MAGIAAVETAILATAVAAMGMPGGYAANTLAASSVAGVNLRLFRGWPLAATLDADLLAGAGQISIYPGTGMARNTTRYLGAMTGAPGAVTLLATVVGRQVTFSGVPAVGQVVGITLGSGVATAAWPYRVQAGDTLSSVAAALAALIPGASAVGAVLTVPDDAAAQVVADGTSTTELRRVQQAFRIGVWMPNPTLRESVSEALDVAFGRAPFIATAAGESVRMIYAGMNTFERDQQARAWRRDLNFLAEYATRLVEAAPGMLFGTLGVGIPVATSVDADILHEFGPAGPPADTLWTDDETTLLIDADGHLLGTVPA